MKTLIVGASGLVGGYLYKTFKPQGEILGTSFPQSQNYPLLDMRDKAALKKIFSAYNPSLVFCPAAISNVELCQQDPSTCRLVNVEGVGNAIEESKRNKSKFIFFSSEYVFDGESGPYKEDDVIGPLNEYGKQKLEVEGLIKSELDDYIIVRTTVVYGWEDEGKNFVMQMLKNLKKGIPMKVPSDQYSSPTYAADLANVISELVTRNATGIFNIVGSQVMNRYEFAKVICQVFNLDSNLVIPVKTLELSQKAIRPLKAGLKIDKVSAIVKAPLHGPLQGLNIMKEERNV